MNEFTFICHIRSIQMNGLGSCRFLYLNGQSLSITLYKWKWLGSLNCKVALDQVRSCSHNNMKWFMLVFLFHLLLICSKCNKVININSQDHLLQLYLCHHYNYTDNTTLLLLDTVYNISGNGSLCTININYSLTIQGNHSMAKIQCIFTIYVNTTLPNRIAHSSGQGIVTVLYLSFK